MTIISEHEVMLGTAAALAGAPTFEGEIEDDPVEAAALSPGIRKTRWLGTLARRIRTSGERRPQRPHYVRHLEHEFMVDARMSREMYRL